MLKSISILLFLPLCAFSQTVITIETEKYSTVSMSEIATHIEFIEFHYPDSMQPQVVSKIFETKDSYIVFDSDSPDDKFFRRVSQFNKKGKFEKVVDYSYHSFYDDVNQIIYSPKGGGIECYSLGGVRLREIKLEGLKDESITNQGFGSYTLFSNKIYYLNIAVFLKERETRYILRSYDLYTKQSKIVYDLISTGSLTNFPSTNSIFNGQLVHHNPNLGEIFLIDNEANITSQIIIKHEKFNPDDRLKKLYQYFFKPGVLIGHYRKNNQNYDFIHKLSNGMTYFFKEEYLNREFISGIKDDIYMTGKLIPLNYNLPDKAYSIRYRHPDGTYGNFIPNSNPGILVFKLN